MYINIFICAKHGFNLRMYEWFLQYQFTVQWSSELNRQGASDKIDFTVTVDEKFACAEWCGHTLSQGCLLIRAKRDCKRLL